MSRDVSAPAATLTWAVQEAPAPASLDDDDAWAVRGAAALDRLVQTHAWGHDDLAYPAAHTLVDLRDRRYTARTLVVATPPDRPRDVVGALMMHVPQVGNTHLAGVTLLVHPEHRRRGVGSALLADAAARARALGRRLLVVEIDHGGEPPAHDPDVLTPPTGSGRISTTDPFARFARGRGLVLEQAERYSVLHLPVEPTRLAQLAAEARAAAEPDYRVVTWHDRCPDRWVDQLAVLQTRMSTDAPMGGLADDLDEDPWDADRVRAAETSAAASGRGALVTAALHVPTGTLVGFTELQFPLDTPEVVFQENTLVLREHRGRRLGQLVKVANLQRLAQVRPRARRVHTWNAEENGHMLRINVALGFRPTGVCGAWRLALD